MVLHSVRRATHNVKQPQARHTKHNLAGNMKPQAKKITCGWVNLLDTELEDVEKLAKRERAGRAAQHCERVAHAIERHHIQRHCCLLLKLLLRI